MAAAPVVNCGVHGSRSVALERRPLGGPRPAECGSSMSKTSTMASEAWARHETEGLVPHPSPPSTPARSHAEAVEGHSSGAATHVRSRRKREQELRSLGVEELHTLALDSGVRPAKIDSALGLGINARSQLSAEEQAETLIALIADHEDFEHIMGGMESDQQDARWRKMTKTIGGKKQHFFKKHNQLMLQEPPEGTVEEGEEESALDEDDFQAQLKLAQQFDNARASRQKKLGSDAHHTQARNRWHMRGRRASVEEATEMRETTDWEIDDLAEIDDLDDRLNMNTKQLASLSTEQLVQSVESLAERMKDEAADAKDETSRAYLESVAQNLTSIVKEGNAHDEESRRKALIAEIKMHRDTDHAKRYDALLDTQLAAIGAQPAPPGMEHSKKNPRQLRVKKLDAVRVVESLLTGAQLEDSIDGRQSGSKGRMLGSLHERKNRARSLKAWCRLNEMAAVVDKRRLDGDENDILRIGRIVRFIERKEDLDHIDNENGKRSYTYQKWLPGKKEPELVRKKVEPEERYVLEKVCDPDGQPKKDKDGKHICKWKWTDGSPSAALSGNTWLAQSENKLHVEFKKQAPDANEESNLPMRMKRAIANASRGRPGLDDFVQVDYRIAVAADEEDIQYACSEQCSNATAGGTKQALIDLIIMCYWKLAVLSRIDEPDVWKLKVAIDRDHDTKADVDGVKGVKSSWVAFRNLRKQALDDGVDILDQTREARLESELFVLTREALVAKARSVSGWAPALLRVGTTQDLKLRIQHCPSGQEEKQEACPWATGTIKDGEPVQIRFGDAASCSSLSAQWCDDKWWRDAPWRDEEWWEQDNAPRSKQGILAWHPRGYPREEPLPATHSDEHGTHEVAFATTPRTLPPTRSSPRSGVLVELEYSTRNEQGDLDNDIIDIRDICDAERLHDGYTLSELNKIAKPHFWCKAGAFATYILKDKVGKSKSGPRTGMVLKVVFKSFDLGTDGRADRKEDKVIVDFGQDEHGQRNLRDLKVSTLREATPEEADAYNETQKRKRSSAEQLEFMEAQVAKKEFYTFSILERKKKGQKWKNHENAALKDLSMDHPLREVMHDEDEESFREREKKQSRALARLMNANLKLTARVLEYARTLGPNADATERAVRNLLVNSPNPLWTCYLLAAHLEEQANYPVVKRDTEKDSDMLKVAFSKVQKVAQSDSDDAKVSVKQLEGEDEDADESSKLVDEGEEQEQEWSREAARKLIRVATKIASALDIDHDDANLCAAFLQPKLNYDPVYLEPSNKAEESFILRVQRVLHGKHLEPRGSTDAGPLYEAICADDSDFVSVDWIKEYVDKISSGSFSLEDEYQVDLPTGIMDGLFGTSLIETARKRMYRWLIESKVWPRWYFVGIFYCWCGLQVPSSLFRVPNFRYAMDLTMYLIFLYCFTWGVVLDRWDVSHLDFVQLSDPTVYEGPFLVSGLRFYSWLYLLGAMEKELRQLVRLGPFTYFSEFWNIVEMISPTSGVLGLAMLEVGSNESGVFVLAASACLLWLRLLQPLRASHSIGPLIPVMLRMISEVLKFAIVVMIVIMGFAVAMHSMLQESANDPASYAAATAALKSWPGDYQTLTATSKTLLRAALGDFSSDFTYADYNSQATFGLGVYILIMMLMLMNLLITLLMKRYDEVQEVMEKQFAFVRGTSVFWLQDSVLDNELPPPFNLLQLIHPDRELLAWLVWLAVAPPVFMVMLMGSTVVVGGLYVPYFAYTSIKKGIDDLTEGDTTMIRDTNISAPVDEDLEFLLSLDPDHGDSGQKVKNNMTKTAQKAISAAIYNIVVDNLLWTATKPLLMVIVIAFGIGHWALIFSCTALSTVFAYAIALRSAVDYIMQFCNDKTAEKLEGAKELEARQKIKRLCENFAACIDFLAEKDADDASSRGENWTNNSETGTLDRLLADEFKSEEELANEEEAKATKLACEGVELARRRKLHASFIQRLWKQAKDAAQAEEVKRQHQQKLMRDAEGRLKELEGTDGAAAQRLELEELEQAATQQRKEIQNKAGPLQQSFELFDKDVRAELALLGAVRPHTHTV